MLHSHNQSLVLLSFVIAAFAAYTAFHTGERIRAASGAARLAWLAAAGIAMGGGIWTMHFIAMLAIQTTLPVTYNARLTFASLAVAIAMTSFGFCILTRGRHTGSSHPGSPVQAMPRLIMAGSIMGLGVAAMHYVGMSAMSMAAEITYDPAIFALSVGIAVVASTIALWLALNVHQLRQRITSAFVMATAVCGMHYTAMAGTRFVAADCVAAPGVMLSPLPLSIALSCGMAVVLGILILVAMTDRKMDALTAKADAALRESEERFRWIAERLPISIALSRLADGKILFSNQRSRELFLVPEQLRGKNSALDIYQNPQDREAMLVHIARHGFVDNFEVGMRRYDGTPIHCLINAHKITMHGEDLLLSGYYDITDRKQAELKLNEINAQLRETVDALRKANEAAQSADRAKSDFLANMSHELRTPLNAVIGFAEVMKSEAFGTLGNPTYKSYVDHIHTSGLRLLKVVNNILEVVQVQAGEIALNDDYMDVAAFMDGLVERAQSEAASCGIHVACHVAADMPARIMFDPSLIRKSMLNLIDNAIKFSPPGSTIEIRAELADGLPVFRVCDNGVGIARRDIDRILLPFGQAEAVLSRRHEGAGLGITLSKLYIEMHGGALSIESALGEGTTVTLAFPPASPSLAANA